MMKSSCTSSGDIVKDIALLLSEGRNGGQDTLSKVTPGTTLRPKAPLVPQHHRTEGAFRHIVCQLHALSMDKGPQGRLVLQQRATQSGTLGVFTRRPPAMGSNGTENRRKELGNIVKIIGYSPQWSQFPSAYGVGDQERVTPQHINVLEDQRG